MTERPLGAAITEWGWQVNVVTGRWLVVEGAHVHTDVPPSTHTKDPLTEGLLIRYYTA